MIVLPLVNESMLLLGPHDKDRTYSRDKANIGNLKGNRGCPPPTANRTSSDCVENTRGPSVQHIPLEVYYIGGLIAIVLQ